MPRLHYHLVDVFTETAFGGNPLAVFPEAEGAAPELMQRLAKELNLSESTFVMPPTDPTCDFRVRIFAPAVEMPTAGHPTVGTTFVLDRLGMIRRTGEPTTIRLEQQVGAIPVSLRADGLVTMTQPLPQFGAVFGDCDTLAAMLSLAPSDLEAGLPLEVVSCGVPFLFVPLRSLEALGRARLRLDLWEKHLKSFAAPQVFLFTMDTGGGGSTVRSRMFAPAFGIVEDPATGIASGPLGAYLVKHRLVGVRPTTAMVSEQGVEMGRRSLIHIEIDSQGEQIAGVRVGGRSVYMGAGFFEV